MNHALNCSKGSARRVSGVRRGVEYWLCDVRCSAAGGASGPSEEVPIAAGGSTGAAVEA